jgi:hypothetical protein
VAASAAAIETTRARVPILSSDRRMPAAAGAETGVFEGVNMNAILYENRSHYYYRVTLLQCKSERRRRSC